MEMESFRFPIIDKDVQARYFWQYAIAITRKQKWFRTMDDQDDFVSWLYPQYQRLQDLGQINWSLPKQAIDGYLARFIRCRFLNYRERVLNKINRIPVELFDDKESDFDAIAYKRWRQIDTGYIEDDI